MRLIAPPTDSGHTNSFDGTPIYWELHGPHPKETKKRTMVFCYGLVCSMNQWRKQIERYSPKHPCILLDYRGHHQSGNPASQEFMNLSALAKDVKAVCDHLQVKDAAHIWGHSMGCNVALEFALAEPTRCQSLVLCCGTADNPFNNMLGSSIPAVLSGRLFDFMKDYPEPIYKVWELFKSKPTLTHISAYLAGFNTDTSTQDDIKAYAEAVSEVSSETFFALLEDMSRGGTRNILPRIKTPTIVVAGALDRVTPTCEQKALAERLPNSYYFEIPAGSHNVQLDFGEYVGLKVEDLWRKEGLE